MFERLGRVLSKEEQKLVTGGDPPLGCLPLNAACNDNVQCCSNYCYSCAEGQCPPTGKICFITQWVQRTTSSIWSKQYFNKENNFMKKFENLGRILSKDDQKQILGGDPPGGCLTLAADCNDNVQCCSNNCRVAEGSTTGKKCVNSD